MSETPKRQIPVKLVLQEFEDEMVGGRKCARWALVYRAEVDGETIEAVARIQYQMQDSASTALAAFAGRGEPPEPD